MGFLQDLCNLKRNNQGPEAWGVMVFLAMDRYCKIESIYQEGDNK